MRKIAVLTGGIPHYRKPFLEAIAARSRELNVVTAGRLGDGFVECDSSEFGVIRLQSGRPAWRRDVVNTIHRLAPDIIVSEHGASLDYVWTVLLSRKLSHIPKLLWTHGIARQELYGEKRGFASLGRWQQIRLADGVVCYDSMTAALVSQRFPHKLVRSAPNSNDGRAIVGARKRLTIQGRAALRERLGLSRTFYLIALGRLVPEKEFHRLVGVLECVRSAGFDAGLILIGGGPEEERIRRVASLARFEDGTDIVFTGPVANPYELTEWLIAGDVCVSPGYLGLSVVDCLFAGVPVISILPGRRGPWHSPEWRYLQIGETGFFANHNDDESLGAACISFLRRDEAERAWISGRCAAYAEQKLGIDPMVDGMLGAVCATLDQSSESATTRNG